jgi:hypothetical protein
MRLEEQTFAEWMNYMTYDRFREARIGFRFRLKQLRLGPMREYLEKIISFGGYIRNSIQWNI